MRPPCKPKRTPIRSLSCRRSTLSNGACPATLLFPPQQRKVFHETILQEILQERVSSSRNRINPRGVKRKMSNYSLRPRRRGRTRRVDFRKRVRIVKGTVLGLEPHTASLPPRHKSRIAPCTPGRSSDPFRWPG